MNIFERFNSFILPSIVAAAVIFSASLSFGQIRALGAGALVLDDGGGHTITLVTPPGLNGNYDYYLPAPPGGNIMSGYVEMGTSIGQTLYWNGTYWAPGAAGGGNFIVNSTSLQSSASFNIDGSGHVGTTLTAGGNVNTTGGGLQTNGTTRIDNSGNGTLAALTLTGISSGTPANYLAIDALNHVVLTSGVGGITGTGTAGTIPVWTGASTQSNSLLTDNGVTLSYASRYIDIDGAFNNDGYQIGGNTVLSVPEGLNLFVGMGAGGGSTGGDNTFAGNFAGDSNGTGAMNTFCGFDAGHSNIAGSVNSAFGFGANMGSGNIRNATAIGANAIVNASNMIQLGDGNVTSVNSNGSFNTTGGDYEIGGAAVLSDSGDENLFLGAGAGVNCILTTFAGFKNTFSGYWAGHGNTSGVENTYFGTSTGMMNTSGHDNTFLGYYVGWQNTGDENTFSGTLAGYGNTSGNDNTFSGKDAGDLNQTGNLNTAIGANAEMGGGNLSNATAIGANAVVQASNTIQLGDGNVTLVNTHGSFNTSGGVYKINDTTVLSDPGTYNIFVGAQSGLSNTTGLQNTFIGAAAGYSNTSAGGNTFVGAGSGSHTATGGANTFVGDNAGNANTAGGNTFVGAGAGEVNTTGEYNTFFGLQTGLANSTGDSNSFIGTAAGWANTTGSLNTFEGFEAGYANTTGAGNTFLGVEAGDANTTASSNTFVGEGSGILNTTGGANTFLGAEAGNSNTTANGNTFVGGAAGIANTTGQYNAIFGFQAGYFNTTGDSNSFMGTAAGQSNTTGSLNTFTGFLAGRLNTTGIGNTFIGDESGLSNTAENSNTFIGYLSNGAPGITNATAIGSGAVVSQSNAVILGNGVDVGIGTSRPRAALDINSTGAIVVPVGTLAQRPGAPVQGMLRLNSTSGLLENYDGSTWNSGGGGGGISGSGTSGRIPIWTGATSQGNSHITDNGTTLYYSGSHINSAGDYQIGGSTVLSVNNIDGANELFVGEGASGSNSLTDATAIGSGATVTTSNTVQLGDGDVTSVNTSGVYSGAGLIINNSGLGNDVTGSSWSVDDGGNGIFTSLTLNNTDGYGYDVTGTNANWFADNTGFIDAANGIEADNGLDVYGDGVYVDVNGIYVNGGIEVGSDDISIDNGNLYVGNSFEVDNDGTTTIDMNNGNDALTITADGGNDITGDSWSVDGNGNFSTGNINLTGTSSDALTLSSGGGNDISGDSWQVDGSGNASFNSLAISTPLDISQGGTNSLPDGNIIIGTGGTPNNYPLSGDATMDDFGDVTVQSYNDGTPFATMASQDEGSVDITGGSIDGTSIGFENPADGSFSTLSAGTGSVFNVDASGNTSTNGTIASNGTINSANAGLATNGITRIDNAGNFTAANITVGGNLVVSTESDAEFNDFVTISGNTVFAEVTGNGSGPIGVIVTNATSGQMLYIYNHSTGAQQLTLNGSVIPQGKIEVFVYYGGNWIGTN